VSHPSEKEIAVEIKRLKDLLPKIRPFTAFGDDNRKALRVQITVLEKQLDEEDVYSQGWDSDTESNAYEAVKWLEGDSEELLSNSWKDLVPKLERKSK
jgi:hypothetical protein